MRASDYEGLCRSSGVPGQRDEGSRVDDWLEIGSTAADGGPLPRPQVGESDRRADWVRLGSLTGEAYRQAPQTAVVPAAPDY
jgi:hypothetical protein